MSHVAGKFVSALLCILLLNTAVAEQETDARNLKAGQWLEVRGHYEGDGGFLADRVDLIKPDRYQVLIGTVGAQQDENHFTVLGQAVEIQAKTDMGNLQKDQLAGQRIKVEGYYRSPELFSARNIDPRGEGRERVVGRIDKISKKRSSVELVIMNFSVVIPSDVLVEYELAWEEYERTDVDAQSIVDLNRDEEDRFGDGYWITDSLQVTGQAQLRGLTENEFDLDRRDAKDRDDVESSIRTRFVYQPTERFFAVGELSYRQLYRKDDEDGRLSDGNTKFGELYFYWLDPLRTGLDLQLGRIDFDDQREWLYDQNLDAIKAIWNGERIRAQISYSETLSDGSPLDEAASNSIVYISNTDDKRNLAGYLIHRDFDISVPLRRTHYGFRAFGEWFPEQESWLDVSIMKGKSGITSSSAWAIDMGNSWQIHDRWALTAGYAHGSGDDSNSATDTTFRQTGLHDNNAKFEGVTSFRYYGELVDPELSNLSITTLGLGWLPMDGTSVDLVWHSYRQDQLSRRLTDTNLDERPNGQNKNIGSELDLVLGFRAGGNLDIELVAAWFKPGKAFTRADDAFLAKLQFRYKF